MRWIYSSAYNYGAGLPLKQIHGFLLDKPRRIREALLDAKPELRDAFEPPPPPATDDDLRLVHGERLVEGLSTHRWVADALEFQALRWLPNRVLQRAVVTPQRQAAAGTVAAYHAAVDGDWVANLSGGYHHARVNLSHGFCLLNDVALAVAKHRAMAAPCPTLVLDLDLHQGDGNAEAFAEHDDVFTVSLHEARAFPHPKLYSDIDLGLDSYLDDVDYLNALDETLTRVRDRFAPSVIIYVAGTDPFDKDPLGTLTLSARGMAERDRRVARFARELGAGLVILPAGGYCSESPRLSAAGMLAIAEVEQQTA